MSGPSPIRNVSDTALWVAIYRAMESERPDALFQDPYARRLAGERGETIVRTIPGGKAGAWPMIVRTKVMDDIILRCVGDGTATVLNLAAGLDTRAYRLDLPASLHWVHVDMPEMVDYYRSHMDRESPRCGLEFASIDLRDTRARRELFARAASRGPVFAISEGLLVYLVPGQVAELALDLHDVARATRWLSDIATPRLRKIMQRRKQLELMRRSQAPMQFFPQQGTAFMQPYGWREAEFHSIWDDSFRLRRTVRGGHLFRLMMKLQPGREREAMRRMSGVALLEAS